jgi:hypothetical protein
MFKLAAIALTIAASSATAVIPSDLPAPGAMDSRTVSYESAPCRDATRQIATYSRALQRLDMGSAANQQKAAFYRQFRQTEQDWRDENCRRSMQTARNDPRNDTL